ncbi:MAG: hydrogenase maturation protein [Nitrosomonadales bacterium]|nr:hydrogenase maturation protein [Nitrosomonadales bacterium]
MRILFLTHSFNSLAQRLFVDLTEAGHEISIEFDIADSVAVEAVALYRPDIILAPFLKRAIPEVVWRDKPCLVVHPGIIGDRGPSALDWAIQRGESAWGATVLQANEVMDGGNIWAAETFPVSLEKKSSLYRNQVTEAASKAVAAALARYLDGKFQPCPSEKWPDVRGKDHPLMRQADRKINWESDDTRTVLRKIHAADGFPGVRDELFGAPCFLFDAHADPEMAGRPGALLGWRGHGAVRATRDGAVRIGHVRRPDGEHTFKLPASVAFASELESLPLLDDAGADGIRYEEAESVGYLYFDFYNGAMSTEQCQRILAAYRQACARPTRVIALMGGEDFWSNGIHLNMIEAADSPADESMRNIRAMDDLAEAILRTTSHLTIAALAANAGAGGAFLALAADQVWVRPGIVLNPHYKNMGNLYGSEFWTYTLPRRVGAEQAVSITQNRLPLGGAQALRMGIADACFGVDAASFRSEARKRASALAALPGYGERLAAKTETRRCDEAIKPLAQYRDHELAEMQRNFYGFDPSYHYARYQFVHKTPHAWTPRHLCRHRDIMQKQVQ